MRSMILLLVIASTSVSTNAYNYQRSISVQSSSSPWITENMDLVEQFADKLEEAFYIKSQGIDNMAYTNQPWSENFARSIGKSTSEVIDLIQKLSDDLLSETESYKKNLRPNDFKAMAASALEKLVANSENVESQGNPIVILDSNLTPSQYINKYPTEEVNGQTYSFNDNWNTATTLDGTEMNRMVGAFRKIHEPTEIFNRNRIPFSQIVTVQNENRQVSIGPDGKPLVSGTRSESVWKDDQLVFNSNTSIGTNNSTKEDNMWKLKEREQLFWLFQNGAVNSQELEEWQANQEDRLLALALRLNITLEKITEWQRHELDSYNALVNQYNTLRNSYLPDWLRQEQGRIDWLIQQNDMAMKDMERWQEEYDQKLVILAKKYQISTGELKAYYKSRPKLHRLPTNFKKTSMDSSSNASHGNSFLNHQAHDTNGQKEIVRNFPPNVNDKQMEVYYVPFSIVKKYGRDPSQTMPMKNDLKVITGPNGMTLVSDGTDTSTTSESIHVFQKECNDRINALNVILQKQGELIQSDQDLNKSLDKQNQILKEQEAVFKNESERLTRVINEQQAELKKLTEGNLTVILINEKNRLENLNRGKDLTLVELDTIIKDDKNRIIQLAFEYHVTSEEIEEYSRVEKERMIESVNDTCEGDNNSLKDWQNAERSRIRDRLMEQSNLTIEDFQKELHGNYIRLQMLAFLNNIAVKKVEQWILNEVKCQIKLKAPVNSVNWEINKKNKLKYLSRIGSLTLDELETLINDKNRIKQLAIESNVRVDEIEEYIRSEEERMINSEGDFNPWKQQEREYLLLLIKNNRLTKTKNFEDFLRITGATYRYDTTTIEDDIIGFFREEYERLIKLNLISEIVDWQNQEQLYIEELLRGQFWYFEELEYTLKNDGNRLHRLANQYDLTFDAILEWYDTYLQKLLQEEKLFSGNLISHETNMQSVTQQKFDEYAAAGVESVTQKDEVDVFKGYHQVKKKE